MRHATLRFWNGFPRADGDTPRISRVPPFFWRHARPTTFMGTCSWSMGAGWDAEATPAGAFHHRDTETDLPQRHKGTENFYFSRCLCASVVCFFSVSPWFIFSVPLQ